MPDLFMQSGATFSACRRYRYRLWRRWADGPTAALIAMNPSTADEVRNDPTSERFVRRIMKWNAAGARYGAAEIVNVFAWRETDSRKLAALVAASVDILGPENDQAILDGCRSAGIVICGWGKPGALNGRHDAVVSMLRNAGIELHSLGINKDGTPKHPLYVGYDVAPRRYAWLRPIAA